MYGAYIYIYTDHTQNYKIHFVVFYLVWVTSNDSHLSFCYLSLLKPIRKKRVKNLFVTYTKGSFSSPIT